MRTLVFAATMGLVAVLFIHCDDDTTALGGADMSAEIDMTAPGPTTTMACLDRPDDDLPRPPGDTLPCELLPPGLQL